MKNEVQMITLITKLKNRNNKAYLFFEQLLSDAKNPDNSKEALERLSTSFAITQYANFTDEEEKLLNEIIMSNMDKAD